MQDRVKEYKNLSHQDSNDYKVFRHESKEHQHSMNLDKNYFILSWMLSNPEFALEMQKLISRNNLSLESVEYTLLWLTKLFNIKWQQLRDDLDYISRWRMNLQTQAEFNLDNFVEDNQRQYRKSKDKKYIPEERSDIISNTEKTEMKEATEQKGNLSETNMTEISEEKFWKSILNDLISAKKTQITNHSELLKHNKDIKDKSPNIIISIDRKFNVSTDDNSIINDTYFSKLKRHRKKHKNRNKNEMKNKTSSKLKKSLSIPHEKHMKEHEKQLSQLENITSVSPTENIINILQKIDQSHRMGTDAVHDSLKNITDIFKIRRGFNVLVPWKIAYNKKDRYVPTKKINKHNYFNKKMEIISDNASAMDGILEAVAEVLPTNKSVEISRKGSETILNTL